MRLLIFIFLCMINVVSYANKIDSLQSNSDVEKFSVQLIGRNNTDINTQLQLIKPDSIYVYVDCFHNERISDPVWKKADFNQDGLTDLFVILYSTDTIENRGLYEPYVILGSDKNEYSFIKVPSFITLGCHWVEPKFIKNQVCLLFNYSKVDHLTGADSSFLVFEGDTMRFANDSIFEVKRSDTLIYRFGGFINANFDFTRSPEISSVFFEADGCHGGCPVFSLNIRKNGQATYVSKKAVFDFINSNENKAGKFKGRVSPHQLNEIFDLIKYMNIFSLKDNYDLLATHQMAGTLIVYFSDGSSKKIFDYGLRGTYSLVRLYALLYDLRKSQDWKSR